jgi:hypothetical protein
MRGGASGSFWSVRRRLGGGGDIGGADMMIDSVYKIVVVSNLDN